MCDPRSQSRTRKLDSELGFIPVAFLNVFLEACSTTAPHGGQCGTGDQQ